MNDEDVHGQMPLELAVSGGNSDVVRMLLAAGSDARVEINSDMTPLGTAVRTGNYEIVRMLIEHHAVLSVDDPLLHMAIYSRNTEIVKLLITHDAPLQRHVTAVLCNPQKSHAQGHSSPTDRTQPTKCHLGDQQM